MAPIRVSGMNSGMDTDAIVEALVEAQKNKVNKAKKEQTLLEWKQDAWKTLNSKMKKLFNNTVTNLRYASTFTKKATNVSHSNLVSVITGSNAVNGSQTLKIKAQAKTGYLTGAQLSTDKSFTATSTMKELDPNFSGRGTINVTSGGKTTSITVNEDTTISDVLTQLKDAGLNASFDEKNQRFFISAKESGLENDFSINAGDANGLVAMNAMGITTSLTDDKASMAEYTQYAAYVGATDADTIANMRSIIDADIAAKVASYVKSNEEANAEISSLQEKIDAIKAGENYDAADTVESLEAAIEEKNAALEAEGLTDEEKKTLMEEKEALQAKLTDVKTIQTYEDEITKLNEKIADNNQYIQDDGNGNFVASATLTSQVETAYLNKANFAKGVVDGTVTISAGATRIAGSDAEIELNGATFTSTSNTFEINGLTITALGVSDEEITINTENDTSGIYDTIKSFLKEFNELAKEMDKLYGTKKDRDYEPLTDEDREEMSEDEIEKWETKIKDSILGGDSTLSTFSNAIYSVMSAGLEVNGEHMFLSDFGIATLGYFDSDDYEKHMYHIDGDPDDDATSSKADKLKSMIASDPDKVADFFSGLANNLLNTWQSMTKTTELSSYGSVYNDKLMKEQYSSYTSKIKELEEKLTEAEDRWYAKFTAMETALAKLNSNQSAISSMLGM